MFIFFSLMISTNFVWYLLKIILESKSISKTMRNTMTFSKGKSLHFRNTKKYRAKKAIFSFYATPFRFKFACISFCEKLAWFISLDAAPLAPYFETRSMKRTILCVCANWTNSPKRGAMLYTLWNMTWVRTTYM